MIKIGVLYGMEESFPPALVDRINAKRVSGVVAEHLKTGGVEMAAPSGYGVIIDRISHDIPFYRSYLKNAVLTGTKVINNPFWWSADDKFFNYALASKLGIAVPATVLLPHKEHPEGTTDRSMRNLEYPLDWDGDLRLRRVSGLPEAARRRRLEERLQGELTRRVLRRLQRNGPPVHDAAGAR